MQHLLGCGVYFTFRFPSAAFKRGNTIFEMKGKWQKSLTITYVLHQIRLVGSSARKENGLKVRKMYLTLTLKFGAAVITLISEILSSPVSPDLYNSIDTSCMFCFHRLTNKWKEDIF